MDFDLIREFGFGSAMDDHSYRSREAEGMTRHERRDGGTNAVESQGREDSRNLLQVLII